MTRWKDPKCQRRSLKGSSFPEMPITCWQWDRGHQQFLYALTRKTRAEDNSTYLLLSELMDSNPTCLKGKQVRMACVCILLIKAGRQDNCLVKQGNSSVKRLWHLAPTFLVSAWRAEQGTWPGEGRRGKEEGGWSGLRRCLCLNPWGPLAAALPLARVRSERVALLKAGLWRSSTPLEAVGLDTTLRGELIHRMACKTICTLVT